MEREREYSRSKAKARAKAPAKGREQQKEQTRSPTIAPDKRLARILTQGSGEFQTYNPAQDRTGRGAQNRQFLDKLIRANGGAHIQKTDDGRYQIDRLAAIEAIQKNRGSSNSSPLSEQTKKAFRFKGEKQADGSLIIDPAKALSQKGQSRFHNTLVNRLESALEKGEQGLSQTPDGRYKLEAGLVKANASPNQTKPHERSVSAKIDQRLARIVGSEPGQTMIYDPMKDQSGQASKNSEYLGKLSKSNTFVESLGGGRFAIDRHAANTALSSTYAQNSDIEPSKAIKTAFAKNGITMERGLQAINPAALKQKDFQPVVNALEKGLREGTKGLSKTQDGTYLMSGHVDSGERGPTLTPTKNWQFWSDLAQRDGLKAVMAGSPLRKEGDMSPSLSLSPGSEKKQQPKLSEKVDALKEMQDDREKQRNRSREQSQKLAQEQRKKLEQQLATEQARLNETLKKHWNSAGVNNVHMQYRADKNQQPLKNELSPSTQKEYSKIARRLENIHPLQMPEYLQKRADQTSRQTWWKEHAVARRMLRSAEKQHFDNGEPEQGKALAATRKNIQGIDYQSNRSQAPTQSHSKRQSQFSGEFYNQLLKDCNKRGDQELHDSLVVSRNSGLRPAELQKGVHMRVTNEATSEVAINIQGAKKSKGLEDAPSRYQNDHGQDRLLIVKSEELAELAKRHEGHFKPNSSEDALRMRLERTTDRLDPENEQNFSFYTLRHNSADEIREQGKSRSEIALHMGHTSEETQEGYGLNA